MDTDKRLTIIKYYPVFLLILMVAYIAAGKISLAFTTMNEGMSIIWFPNGILLAVFLLRPMREWLWIVLA
ncbi:MAG: MASE1 domain-containing protein, partial [Sulfuricurvum sp.]|nr:MASE1 domain-containing protein [Sulfuricurvum sp.]